MKILAFVDMHGSLKALKKVKEQAKKADIIVCAGDISIFSNDLDKLLSEIDKLNKTLLIIHGNHESDEDLTELAKLFKNITNLHKKSFVKGKYLFMGYGGSGFSIVDKDFEKTAMRFEKEIKAHKDKKTILVTHAPPYKTKLDNIMGEAYGNKSIKNFIKKVNLHLVISGHLHENAGKQDRIKNTIIINPGPYGKIISI